MLDSKKKVEGTQGCTPSYIISLLLQIAYVSIFSILRTMDISLSRSDCLAPLDETAFVCDSLKNTEFEHIDDHDASAVCFLKKKRIDFNLLKHLEKTDLSEDNIGGRHD